jgi:hypothetical protein
MASTSGVYHVGRGGAIFVNSSGHHVENFINQLRQPESWHADTVRFQSRKRQLDGWAPLGDAFA